MSGSVETENASHANGNAQPVPDADNTINSSAPSEKIQANSTLENGQSKRGIVKTPFDAPAPEAVIDPESQLTPEQQTKYDELLKTVSSWNEIPTSSAKNAPTAPLDDSERFWLTRQCLLRYLRAVKWNVADAPKRLEATLVWRREYIGKKLTPDYVGIENETGKQIIAGYDVKARPCLYLIPSRQNTKKSERQLEHLVFMLERVIDLMVPGQESLSLLINFKDSSGGEIPSASQGRQTIHFLQAHYPERLGRAYVINLPWYVNGFFKLILPFVDPVSRAKLKFNENTRDHVPASQLLTNMEGDIEFPYDHSVYWPALNKLADERRTAQWERWISGGKITGEDETYLRGGPAKSLGPQSQQADPTTDIADAAVPT